MSINKNYTLLHIHSDYSLLDSCTKYEDYVDKAVENGMTAIASTEHGNIFNWVEKKTYCDKMGIKYIHGVELYMTSKLTHHRKNIKENKTVYTIEDDEYKLRDNYHVILLAKNEDGLKELNLLVSNAWNKEHFYHKPRITFDEFLNTTDNIIRLSACLASPLWSIKHQIEKYKREIDSNNIDIKNLKDRIQAAHDFIESVKDEVQTIRGNKKKNKEKAEKTIQDLPVVIDAYEFNNRMYSDEIKYLEEVHFKLTKHYSYLEVQPHANSQDQKDFNKLLLSYSKDYNIPIVCGTDTHNLNGYKGECREIIQIAKGIEFLDEDTFDLSFKTFDEIYQTFIEQGVLSKNEIEEALSNTNVIADSIEDFVLDTSFKYPIIKSKEEDEEEFFKLCFDSLDKKMQDGILNPAKRNLYVDRVNMEIEVFKKVGMAGFMFTMADFIGDARKEGIAFGAGRGSAAGSLCAYLCDINDVDPIVWRTIFSRFCNEDRIELGDVDIDIFEDNRPEVFRRIVNKIGVDKTAHVFALGTVKDKGTIDEIGRALDSRWKKENGKDLISLKRKKREIQNTELDKEKRKNLLENINIEIKKVEEFNNSLDSPYSLQNMKKIKAMWEEDPDVCREKYKDVFYYFDGIEGTKISQSMHPAGMIASPITLADNYGTLVSGDSIVLQLDMNSAHHVGLAKYDLLGLKTVGVVDKAYTSVGLKFPRMHEVDWNDEAVWKDMRENNIGIFQFEKDYAGFLLKQMGTKSLFDMSLVNAMIRPSGESYRDALSKHIVNQNSDERISKLLENSYGYLVYQEDIIAFLQEICGLSGSAADTVRRAIGQKKEDVIKEWLPKILDGFCNGSSKPREEAEKDAKEYLKIIEDASFYSFGYNHSISYCMLGYLCAYLRYYYPEAFITAFLNCAKNEEDISNGTKLAIMKKIQIKEPKFRKARSEYSFDSDEHIIYKGIESIKYISSSTADELYKFRNEKYNNFFELLLDIKNKTSVSSRELTILILLDFFAEFGNSKLLLRYVDVFNLFYTKTFKGIKKDKICSNELFLNIVKNNSIKETDTTFVFNNISDLFQDLDDLMCSLGIEDFNLIDKIKSQKDYLGYIALKTDKTEDKYKVVALKVTPLKAMKGRSAGQIWCRALITHSVGRGRTGEFKILESTFKKNPFSENNILLVKDFEKKTYKGKMEFWITKYDIINL